jgi:uncharacterized membrane protein
MQHEKQQKKIKTKQLFLASAAQRTSSEIGLLLQLAIAEVVTEIIPL